MYILEQGKTYLVTRAENISEIGYWQLTCSSISSQWRGTINYPYDFDPYDPTFKVRLLGIDLAYNSDSSGFHGTVCYEVNGTRTYDEISDGGDYPIEDIQATIVAYGVTEVLLVNEHAEIRAKDAYEIAVEEGFEGTRSEWAARFPQGPQGPKGEDYVLTDDDKKEIAAAVPIVKVPSEPLFAPSLETMADTTKAYVHTETMTFWRYQKATYEATLKDIIESTDDNPVHEGYYVSKGVLNAQAGYFTTPYINLGKYSGQIILKVKGVTCLSASANTCYSVDLCDENRNYLGRAYMTLASASGAYVVNKICDSLDDVIVDGDTTTFVINLPRKYDSSKLIHYIRFTCGSPNGSQTWANTEISISYQETVTDYTWIDSGISYTPNVTEADKQDIVNEVVSIIDSELISIIGDGEVSV